VFLSEAQDAFPARSYRDTSPSGSARRWSPISLRNVSRCSFHLLQSEGEVPWTELVQKIWGRDGTKNDLEKTVQRLRGDLGREGYRVSTTHNGYKLAV